VAGQVTSVSAAFANGGFFKEGDVLLTVDPRDYEVAVARAEAQVAQAELRLSREKEEAEVARQEWERVGHGKAPPLALRQPQVAEARAGAGAARAGLRQAELSLSRTVVRAPYDGRVRSKAADVGQYVGPGTPLGRIYAVDYAEVRLPLHDSEMAYLPLSFDFRGPDGADSGPEVILRSTFAGTEHTWTGRVVRVEGEIDARSRMVTVVARVPSPYDRSTDATRPPLAVGMFVEAEIIGRSVDNVVVLPRPVLRAGDRVLVVDGAARLHFRDVDVLRSEADSVIVQSGLGEGERVCVSALDAAVGGMRVRVAGESGAVAALGEGGRR